MSASQVVGSPIHVTTPDEERPVGLQARITTELTQAMKARDRERTGALRLLVAALKNHVIAQGRGPSGELDDDEVRKVLATEKKRREEAASAYRGAGRDDQAAREQAEADLIAGFLPRQLSDDDLDALLDDVIARVGATGPGDLGQVMRTAMAEAAGRAEGRRVSDAARAKLAGS